MGYSTKKMSFLFVFPKSALSRQLKTVDFEDCVTAPKIRDMNINDIPYPYSGSFSAVWKSILNSFESS